MTQRVIALFQCYGASRSDEGTLVQMRATQGESGEESKAFHDATPSGDLMFFVAAGKEAADYFQAGEQYYLTFEKKENVSANDGGAYDANKADEVGQYEEGGTGK